MIITVGEKIPNKFQEALDERNYSGQSLQIQFREFLRIHRDELMVNKAKSDDLWRRIFESVNVDADEGMAKYYAIRNEEGNWIWQERDKDNMYREHLGEDDD